MPVLHDQIRKSFRVIRRKWKTCLWAIRNMPARVHPNPIFIVGNQKTGSTAIAALLAKACRIPVRLDLFCRVPYPAERQLLEKTLSFPQFVQANPWLFSKPLIKEPGLIFHLESLISCFPDSKIVFLLRDPRHNIRSILNRLQLPGNQSDLSEQQIQTLPSLFWKMVIDGSLFQTRGGNYIETLALRWRRSVECYERCADRLLLLKYEDFMKDKSDTIYALARQAGLQVTADIGPQVNVQYQPRGDHSIPWPEFFGRDNLAIIESICQSKMESYGYPLSAKRS